LILAIGGLALGPGCLTRCGPFSRGLERPLAAIAGRWQIVAAGYGIGLAGAVRRSGVQIADHADNIVPFRQKR